MVFFCHFSSCSENSTWRESPFPLQHTVTREKVEWQLEMKQGMMDQKIQAELRLQSATV